MCGIAGVVGAPLERELLERMTRSLAHRGPDGEGFHQTDRVALGHRRLAVIDLESGQQPLHNEDGSVTAVVNGEIYGFVELRKELIDRGHRFATRTDAEVVVHLYEEEGDAFVEKLRGMFAIALWDERRGRLVLARDRLGLKPLFHARLPGGGVAFASEMKALAVLQSVPREVDPLALDDYLALLYVPAPRTIVKGVHKLPPGHRLTWQAGDTAIRRYWTLRPAPPPASLEAAQERLDVLLEESVRLRMVSDVPLGAFLSGGMDSSTLVYYMTRCAAERVRTFSIGFGEGSDRYDEREEAAAVARHLDTEHHEFVVRPDAVELLPHLVSGFDEPFGNPTALLSYLLSRETRRHVTVALAGDGGDEVLLGYPRYQGLALQGLYRRLPELLRTGVAAPLAGLIPESSRGFHWLRRAREFLQTGGKSPREAYLGWIGYFDGDARRGLYTREWTQRVENHDPMELLRHELDRYPALGPRSAVEEASFLDLHSFLPYNLLAYGDRTSMAHALELRLPFTDHHLVEFLAGLPTRWKLRGLTTKWLLRRLMRGRLPAVVTRRPKLGFNPPMGHWLRGELAPLVDDYLGESAVKARGIFEPAAVQRLIREQRQGPRDLSLHVWALLFLEAWFREGVLAR